MAVNRSRGNGSGSGSGSWFTPRAYSERLLLAVEGPGGGGDEDDGEGADDQDLFTQGHDVAQHGDADPRPGIGAQEDLADGVHAIGEWVELADDLEPLGCLVDREEDPRQEDEREDQELDEQLEALLGAHIARDQEAQPGQRDGQDEHDRDQEDDDPDVQVHAHNGRDEEHERHLEERHHGGPCCLAEHDPGPADGSDQQLAEEPELAVPHDRHAREQGRGQDPHGDDAGVHELDEVDAGGDRADEVAEAGPENDKEDQRLGKGPDHPRPLVHEPEQLAIADDPGSAPDFGHRFILIRGRSGGPCPPPAAPGSRAPSRGSRGRSGAGTRRRESARAR